MSSCWKVNIYAGQYLLPDSKQDKMNSTLRLKAMCLQKKSRNFCQRVLESSLSTGLSPSVSAASFFFKWSPSDFSGATTSRGESGWLAGGLSRIWLSVTVSPSSSSRVNDDSTTTADSGCAVWVILSPSSVPVELMSNGVKQWASLVRALATGTGGRAR